MTLAPPAPYDSLVDQRGRAMGTNVQVVVVGGPADLAPNCFLRLEQLEEKWSRFRPDSEVSIVNAANGKPVIVSAETFDLIGQARDGSLQTNGLFDPTVGAAIAAAGYRHSFDTIHPDTCQPTGPAQAAPGALAIELDSSLTAVRLTPGTQLDLGGIGKGAAADLIVAETMAHGARGVCVNVGGDIRVDGIMAGRLPWPITLECPGADIELPLLLRRGAVCTSTILRRRWLTESGVRHHLLIPSTGDSATSGLVSVSVIAATATSAEVMTKAVLVGGPDIGRQMINERQLGAVLVHDDGRVERIGTAPFEVN